MTCFQRAPSRRLRVLAAVLACLALPTLGSAQVGASVSLASDFRYRGSSLSDGKPALSASLTSDHPGGVYLGVTGIGAETARDGVQALGYQAYAGYAHRMAAGGS